MCQVIKRFSGFLCAVSCLPHFGLDKASLVLSADSFKFQYLLNQPLNRPEGIASRGLIFWFHSINYKVRFM